MKTKNVMGKGNNHSILYSCNSKIAVRRIYKLTAIKATSQIAVHQSSLKNILEILEDFEEHRKTAFNIALFITTNQLTL